MIVKLGGRGSCQAAVPQKNTARQELRPPEIRLHLEFAEIHDCTHHTLSASSAGSPLLQKHKAFHEIRPALCDEKTALTCSMVSTVSTQVDATNRRSILTQVASANRLMTDEPDASLRA